MKAKTDGKKMMGKNIFLPPTFGLLEAV